MEFEVTTLLDNEKGNQHPYQKLLPQVLAAKKPSFGSCVQKALIYLQTYYMGVLAFYPYLLPSTHSG